MGDMGHETVTVAIPVYNGERYLREALASVRQQTRAATETLVFDNCSTDATREIAREFLDEAEVRTSEANVGAVANFNRAVEQSTGEYFAWLGADDRLAPRFIEAGLAALSARPGAAACLPGIRFIDPDGAPAGVQQDPELASTDVGTRLRSYLRRPRWTEVYCLYRRDALAASPGFTDEYGADVLLMWWFLLRGPLVVIEELLVEYRTYPTKSADETAESLNPDAPRRRWLMTHLWLSLWRDAGANGVEPRITRVARRELVLCLLHRHWLHHIAWDYYLVAGDVLRRLTRPWRRR